MNVHLPMIAGLLALLAIGVIGAAPGGITEPPAGVATCTLHLAVNVPMRVSTGLPVQISAVATSSNHCALIVRSYAFTGMPQGPGMIVSQTGMITVLPELPGMYVITVIATTSLGSIGNAAPMQVV